MWPGLDAKAGSALGRLAYHGKVGRHAHLGSIHFSFKLFLLNDGPWSATMPACLPSTQRHSGHNSLTTLPVLLMLCETGFKACRSIVNYDPFPQRCIRGLAGLRVLPEGGRDASKDRASRIAVSAVIVFFYTWSEAPEVSHATAYISSRRSGDGAD